MKQLRRTVSVSKAWFLCAKELYCCQKTIKNTMAICGTDESGFDYTVNIC